MPSACGFGLESNAGIQAGAGWRNFILTAKAVNVNGFNGTNRRFTRPLWDSLKLNFMIFVGLINLCPERRAFPPSAQGFDELDGGDEALTGKLGVAAFGLQCLAAGVHNFEIT